MHHRFRPRSLGALACVAAALYAPSVLSQSDEAGAETLLNEALKHMSSHDYARACPELEESLRLYSSLNTEYFLANCYEHAGRMATAWVDYLEVAEKARAAGESAKERKARERASQIESKVAHLTIRVGDAGASLKIERDGMEVGRAQWGLPMPVDSGVHVVAASAPGHVPVTLHANLERDGDEASVTIPPLEAEAPPTPAAAVQPAPSSAPLPVTPLPATVEQIAPAVAAAGRGQRVAGWIVGGAGVAAMGVAGALAISAKSSYDSAPGCTATACTSESGFEDRSSAHRQGNVATVVLVVGAAAVVGGGVLWLTAPSSTTAGAGRPASAVRFGVGPGVAIVDAKF